MNKLFLFITAILFCFIAESQERHDSYAKLLSDSFIEETNGFIDKVVNEENRTFFYIGLPSFYGLTPNSIPQHPLPFGIYIHFSITPWARSFFCIPLHQG